MRSSCCSAWSLCSAICCSGELAVGDLMMNMIDPMLLTLVTFFPVAGVAAILAAPRAGKNAARWIALAASGLTS
jgi:hypothetical protein